MNNTEAIEALATKSDAATLVVQNVNNTIQDLREYINEMDNWKTAVITAKMAAIKTGATAAGVDLSTWDGSAAPVESE